MENTSPQKDQNNDKESFGVPVKKSPWLIYALAQIPIVIIMIIILYFAYQNFKNGNN